MHCGFLYAASPGEARVEALEDKMYQLPKVGLSTRKRASGARPAELPYAPSTLSGTASRPVHRTIAPLRGTYHIFTATNPFGVFILTSPDPENKSAPLLESDQLGRRDPDGDKWLLRNITLRLDAGVRLAIAGASGSGKSLLLRALALLDPIDEGAIKWRGEPAGKNGSPDYRRQVMYLHQQPSLLEGTVEQNLEQPFALKIYRSEHFDKDVVTKLLGTTGRDASFLQKSSSDLSGGERQIVALIRAIQLKPAVLLLDEPTAALDQGASDIVEELLNGWIKDSRDHRALVQVSHDTSMAERFADRIIHIENGTIKEG